MASISDTRFGRKPLNSADHFLEIIRLGVGSSVVFGGYSGGGVLRMPLGKTMPLMKSASSGQPFNDRQRFDAASISLMTITRHAARLPFPFVLSCLSRIVANALLIGLIALMRIQCSAG
jgi:hypothetical protein